MQAMRQLATGYNDVELDQIEEEVAPSCKSWLMRTPRGETKARPRLAPCFISNPSKYIIQYSSSMAGQGIWVLVHSAMKSMSASDLIAIRGAYEIP
jgi:hypothetical protein